MGDEKMYYSLFFEARSIQSYIFDSGKMKEMVGASELIKELCAEKLDELIDYCRLKEIISQSKADAFKIGDMKKGEIFFSRRSGGVFTAIFADKDDRDKFLGLWSLFVTTFVPGLEVVYAVSEDKDLKELIQKTYKKLAQNRNFPPVVLPEATPMHVLAPRTGTPAVENKEEADGNFVWIDESSRKKIKIADNDKSSDSLSKAFLTEDKQSTFSFPKNLEFDERGVGEFPFKKDSRYLGLIHADGNSLGQTLLDIRENIKDGSEYAVMLRLFSDNLEKSTMEAAQEATNKLIEKFKAEPENDSAKVLPMRPLVLGGDDLTVIVRADYAMSFTEDYCKAFEERTKENFKTLHEQSNNAIPEKLTACAGLAYIKNNQPFMDAFELAESLCSASKKVSKDSVKDNTEVIPATVTNMVVSNSFIETYEKYKEKELTVKMGNEKYVATLGAYAINDDEKKIPTLNNLRSLCKELTKDGVTPSSIREYATMIFGSENISDEKWRRWMEMLKKRGLFKGLSECMKNFGVDIKKSPWTDQKTTPIFDAIQLLSMEYEKPKRQSKEQNKAGKEND